MGWNNLSVNLAPQQNQLLNLSHSAQNSWQVSGALDSEGLRKDTQGLKDSFNDIMKPLIDREIGDQYFQKKEEVKQSKLAELSKGNEDIYKQLKEKQALKDFITSEADEASQMAFGTNLTNASKTLDAYAMNNGYVDMTAMLAAAQSGDQQANRKLMSSGIGDIAKQVSTLNTQYKRLMTQPLDYSDYEQLGEAAYRKGLVSSVQEGMEKYIWSKEGNGMLQLQEQGLKSANDSIAQNKWVNQHFSQDQLKSNERPQKVSNQTPQIHSQYNNQTQQQNISSFMYQQQDEQQLDTQSNAIPNSQPQKYEIRNAKGISYSNDEEGLAQVNNLKQIGDKLTIADLANNPNAIKYLGLDDNEIRDTKSAIQQYNKGTKILLDNPKVQQFLKENNTDLMSINKLPLNKQNEFNSLINSNFELAKGFHAFYKSQQNFSNRKTISALNSLEISTNSQQSQTQNTQSKLNETQLVNDTLQLIRNPNISSEKSQQLSKNIEQLVIQRNGQSLNLAQQKDANGNITSFDKTSIEVFEKLFDETSNYYKSFSLTPNYLDKNNIPKDSPISDIFKNEKITEKLSNKDTQLNNAISTLDLVTKIAPGGITTSTLGRANSIDQLVINLSTNDKINTNLIGLSKKEMFKDIKTPEEFAIKFKEDAKFRQAFNEALISDGIFSNKEVLSDKWTDSNIAGTNNIAISPRAFTDMVKTIYGIKIIFGEKSFKSNDVQSGAAIKEIIKTQLEQSNALQDFQNKTPYGLEKNRKLQGNK